tara:strand:- start:12383 stop:13444 length:1062 start_codon:yes stop_codon:yes gene_type:complete
LADPEIEIGGSIDQFGLNDDESVWEVAIAQEFPLTHRLARERDLSAADLALAQAEVRMKEWEFAAIVRRDAIDALAIKTKADLQEQLRAGAEEVASAIKQAFQAAEASQLDVTDSELELRSQIDESRRLRAQEIEANGKLRSHMSLPPDATVNMAGRLGISSRFVPITITDEVLSRRPDLQLHMLKEGRAEAAIALAKSQRWQDVAVKLFMEREAGVDEPDGLERNTFLGIGLSFQLPLRTPVDRLTAEPRGELAMAKATTAALAAQIRNEIATANQIAAERHRIWQQASGETLQLARRHVSEVNEAWQIGKVDFFRLRQAQERALNLEKIAVESLRDFHQARAELQFAAALP